MQNPNATIWIYLGGPFNPLPPKMLYDNPPSPNNQTPELLYSKGRLCLMQSTAICEANISRQTSLH